MSDSYDANVDNWLDNLTDQQSRAINHQIGLKGTITDPIDKIKATLKFRKNFKKVKRIYEEHYGIS